MASPSKPVSNSADAFLSKLEGTGLFAPDHCTAMRSWISAGQLRDRNAVIDQVCKNGWCTPWQAEELKAGRYKFVLGQYRLIDRIGAGGRGTVFKAVHTSMNRMVALKVMAPELLDKPEAVERFRREVKSAAALRHPNIISAFDAAQDESTHFLVMEFLEGRDLHRWMKKHHPLPIGWACECLRQSALGLHHAHEKGMVHRDIKPGNLFISAAAVDDFPDVKVLDLGCALIDPDAGEDERLTMPMQSFGTPDYMAPEQGESARNADARSDVYSLGATLFKVLTDAVPFPGKTPMQKLLAKAANDPPDVRQFRAEIPEGLALLISRTMARDVQKRPQTAAEFAEELAPFCMQSKAAKTQPTEAYIPPEPPSPGPEEVAEAPESAAAEPLSVDIEPETTTEATIDAPSAPPPKLGSAVAGGMCLGGLAGVLPGLAVGGGLAAVVNTLAPELGWLGVLSAGIALGISLGAAYGGICRGLGQVR